MEVNYIKCRLCARHCEVDRNNTVGFCNSGVNPVVSRAALHMWEEPIISGTRGSGTIFFSGCSLGCIFCQNYKISKELFGREISVTRLAEIMLELEEKGAHNINLVTPTHFVPSIREAILLSRREGLSVPIVYNTGGYDDLEAIRSLDGLIDIYLPDFKYHTAKTAKEYSKAENYCENAKKIIAEMHRQTGEYSIGDDGIMRRGMIVRIMLLPERVAEAKLILKYLLDTYGDKIYVSLMNQYTPIEGMSAPLNRKVTREEYRQLVSYGEKLGLRNGFVQDSESASSFYTPDFDLTGV